jgi:hypothetical protein
MAVALLGCIPGAATYIINEAAYRIADAKWDRMMARYDEDMHRLMNVWRTFIGDPEKTKTEDGRYSDRGLTFPKCPHRPECVLPETECSQNRGAIVARYNTFKTEQASGRKGARAVFNYGMPILAYSAIALSILFAPAAAKGSLLVGGGYVLCTVISTGLGYYMPIISRMSCC